MVRVQVQVWVKSGPSGHGNFQLSRREQAQAPTSGSRMGRVTLQVVAFPSPDAFTKAPTCARHSA